MQQVVKTTVAGVFSLITYAFGGWSFLLTAFFVLNILDFILGILSSREALSSKRLTEGGTKKGIMWMWILIANLLNLVLKEMGYSIGISIANWVTIYYILTEIVSLEENSIRLGVPIPKPVSFITEKLKLVLNEKFKMEDDKNDKKIN